jgi:cyclophilin family peptidyl-prolyl cis-trans isomerase
MQSKQYQLLSVLMVFLMVFVFSSCSGGKKYVVLSTNLGKIKMELYPRMTPKTIDNFLELVGSDFYDNKIFHRVIKDFMIQTGGINMEGINEDVGYLIPDEINPKSLGMSDQEILALEAQGYRYYTHFNSISLERGVVAMANRGPNTGSSQFFIITANEGTPWLNGKHTAFARVIKGMSVVDAISEEPTNEGDRPKRRIYIKKAYRTFWPW